MVKPRSLRIRLKEEVEKVSPAAADDPAALAEPLAAGDTLSLREISLRRLTALKEKHDAGDKPALIGAITICARAGMPLPPWVSEAWIAADSRIKDYGAKSWDDVFGVPHPKGRHIETARRHLELAIEVYERVEEIKREEPATPVDAALFERVGQEHCIGKTTCETLYYKQREALEAFDEAMDAAAAYWRR